MSTTQTKRLSNLYQVVAWYPGLRELVYDRRPGIAFRSSCVLCGDSLLERRGPQMRLAMHLD